MKHELEKIINLCLTDGINSKAKIKDITEGLLIEAELHDLYEHFFLVDDSKTKSVIRREVAKLHVKKYNQQSEVQS